MVEPFGRGAVIRCDVADTNQRGIEGPKGASRCTEKCTLLPVATLRKLDRQWDETASDMQKPLSAGLSGTRLRGALSNPRSRLRLEAALRTLRRLSRRTGRPRPRNASLPPRQGAIEQAIRTVLEASTSPMRPRDVHAAVERLLDRHISQDTVGSYLSVASRRASVPINRVARGRYRWE